MVWPTLGSRTAKDQIRPTSLKTCSHLYLCKINHCVFSVFREEMSKDCVVRIVKLEPLNGNCEHVTSKTGPVSVNLCGAVDIKASACDRIETLQRESTTDEQNVVCRDAGQNVNDLKMREKDVHRTGDMNSPVSDDGHLVIVDEIDDNASDYEVNVDLQSHCSHDNSSNYEVDIDLPSQSFPDSVDTAKKTHERDHPEDVPKMCLSCVGMSALHTVKTSQQYQPFVKLKRLDPAELNRWRSTRKPQSKAQDEGHTGSSKYVIYILFSSATIIVINNYIF